MKTHSDAKVAKDATGKFRILTSDYKQTYFIHTNCKKKKHPVIKISSN